MRDALSVLAERTVSAFPLSIGTSLAFESLFDGRQAPYDNERELPSRINIDDYKIFLINVGTLIRNIIKLDLLESHTGVLKTRKEFNTKYYDYKKLELENMPFQRKLLAIFGDHVLFKPYPLKIRQVFIDVARKSKWTPITSEYKVDNDINMYVADLGIKQEFRLI